MSTKKPPQRSEDKPQSTNMPTKESTPATAVPTAVDTRNYVPHPTNPEVFIGRISKIPSGYRVVSFTEALDLKRLGDHSQPLPLAPASAVVRKTRPQAIFYVQHRWQSDNKA